MLLMLLFGSFAFSQKGSGVYTEAFSDDALDLRPGYQLTKPGNTDEIEAFLSKIIPVENCSWKVISQQQSPGGFHYTFIQQIFGVRVFDSETRVNVSRNGKVVSVSSNAKNIKNDDLKFLQQPFQQPNYAAAYLRTNFPEYKIQWSEQVFAFPKEGKAQPALLLNLKDNAQHQYEVLLGNESVLYVRDRNSYFSGDSLVNGMVFNPDPLTTAHVTYGGAYRDYNDSDVTQLNVQRQLHTFRAEFSGDTFRLRNNYVRLVDLNNDNIIPVVSLIPQFYFTRSQKGFEDVNAFYHLTQQQHHVQQLGFNCADPLVLADPHGLGTCQGSCDNSYFSPPQNLLFGQGGVDDAEDADVLIHEYTHFLSYNASPGSNSGMSRSAVDEGCGDYFAAAYSKAIDDYHWGDVYNWDGHNEFWDGRSVVQPWRIPVDSTNSIYHNGQIWSAALMHLHDIIGRNACDSLVLEFLYSLAPNQSFQTMAQNFVEADTLLTGGAYFCPIYQSFFPRGLLPYHANSCGVYPLAVGGLDDEKLQFISGENSFTIRRTGDEIPLSISIYSLNGQLLAQTQRNFFNGEALPAGVYVVRAESDTFTATFKWVKYQ